MTGKLAHWAKLLVDCTLGLTVIFVSLRLWDKIHIVILFPEDLLLHHIPTLFIKPSVSVLNLPLPAPPASLHALQFLFCWSPPNLILPALSSQALYTHPLHTDAVTKKKKKDQAKSKCVLA